MWCARALQEALLAAQLAQEQAHADAVQRAQRQQQVHQRASDAREEALKGALARCEGDLAEARREVARLGAEVAAQREAARLLAEANATALEKEATDTDTFSVHETDDRDSALANEVADLRQACEVVFVETEKGVHC